MEKVTAEIEVEAPVRRVYEQWARLEELPSFMSMVEEVRRTGDDTTHWTVRVAGVRREFDARTTELVPNERISWTSIAEEMHAGSVRFTPIDAERTRVAVELGWAPRSFVEKAGAALHLDQGAVEADLRKFPGQHRGPPSRRRHRRGVATPTCSPDPGPVHLTQGLFI